MIELVGIRQRCLSIDRLELPPGTTVIIGPNGAGKTLFCMLCAGVLLPDEGMIAIDGLSPREAEVGWVGEFPDRNMLFSRVYDEIASPLRFARVSCRTIDDQVQAAAEAAGCSGLLDRNSRTLSGGEKVLVALATALAGRPRALVLDEFDSHLDAATTADAEAAVAASAARYVIRCTQDMAAAARADLLLYFENGRILHAGSPPEVFSRLSGTCFYPPLWRLPR
jgi:energy-coupling factor transport system ATP-binding protein